MFVHCHHCGWEQDDFWEEGGYNPFPNIEELKEHLFAENWDDEWLAQDGPFPALTHRDYVVGELLRAAKRVWRMRFRTREEWNGQPCPVCGNGLCVD